MSGGGATKTMIRRPRRYLAFSLMLFLLAARLTRGNVSDFDDVKDSARDENAVVVYFEAMDGNGNVIQELNVNETVYVALKTLPLYDAPGGGEGIAEFKFGAKLTRVGVCENGYSHVVYQGSTVYEGYVQTRGLSDSQIMERMQDSVVIQEGADVLDYPSRRDGEVIGEVSAEDVVIRTGSYNNTWTRIWYTDLDGTRMDGYVLSSVIKGYIESTVADSGSDSDSDSQSEGILHENEGKGVFTEAVEGVTQAEITTSGGVLIGTPESVTEQVTLVPLGVFRITHYCPCSICCGPYADGITSTGVTAVTNHTIAVQPSQIPYGSRVAINGQVYYAEDCGGAIVENCIDVYVATHEEALEKGVFYTEVYLVT